jgi:FkbM family methyltransferase
MGKPVWLLLPRPADWRWLEDREDSPWYPTMRLFRQARRLDWDEVVERVTSALEAFSAAGPAVGSSAIPPASQGSEQAVAEPIVAEVGDDIAYRPGFSAVAEVRNAIVQYLPDDRETGESIRRYGEYLQPQLDWLLRLVRPGSTIVEAGSGPGMHALALSRAVGEAGQLFLYEPRPKLRQILEHNLAANRIGNATVMKRSLGSQGEPSAALAESPGASPDMAVPAAIISETLDELGLERLTWLKVNESVSASDVLDGASETLWRLRPMLLLHAADEAAIAALAAKAKEFSYRCWTMRTPFFNPDNFNCRTDDIFAGRAALALVAIPEEVEVDIMLEGCVEIP